MPSPMKAFCLIAFLAISQPIASSQNGTEGGQAATEDVRDNSADTSEDGPVSEEPGEQADQPGEAETVEADQTPEEDAVSNTPDEPAVSTTQSEPARAVAVEPVSNGSGNGFWMIFALLCLLLSLISTGLAVWMFNWRRRLPAGDVSEVQDQVIGRFDHVAGGMSTLAEAYGDVTDRLDKLGTAHRDQIGTVKTQHEQLLQGLQILARSTDAKDEEIRKLKEGADKQAIVRDLKRFVKVLRLLERDIADDRADGKDVSSLESIHQYLQDALFDTGLETFQPEIGSDFRKRRDVEDRYEVADTDDSEQDWMITDTVSEGYRLQTGNDPLVIEKAKVKIYRYKSKED